MGSFHWVLSACLASFAALTTYYVPAWGQVRPALDPDIPSYTSQSAISGNLLVSGSDTMKPLVQAWVDDLTRRHPKLKAVVRGEGSETGLAALLAHRTEIAAMSRRMTATEISTFVKEYGYEPTEIPVANDAVAIFVHKDNPINGLSLEELDATFCRERRRGLGYFINSWGLVGVMDDWFEAPIRLYGRNGNSGTSYLFREEVCKGGTFQPQLTQADGSASVVLDVGNDEQGIGFSSIGYQSSLVKPVPISMVKGGRYVEPTFDAVMDGSYPLKRHLYLYIARAPKTRPDPILTELVRFALSTQGQLIARDHGYFPLSSMEITRLIAKWAPSVVASQTGTMAKPILQ